MSLAWTFALIVLASVAYVGYRIGRWAERRAPRR